MWEGSESDGETEIRFVIPLDSEDSYDRPLKEGVHHTIILAHGPDDADDFTTRHKRRTYLKTKL